MKSPATGTTRSRDRRLAAVLTNVERIRRLCDRVEEAIWDAIGAPRPRRRRS